VLTDFAKSRAHFSRKTGIDPVEVQADGSMVVLTSVNLLRCVHAYIWRTRDGVLACAACAAPRRRFCPAEAVNRIQLAPAITYTSLVLVLIVIYLSTLVICF